VPSSSRRLATAEGYVAVLEAALADEDEDGALLVAELDGRVVGFVACFVGEDARREVMIHELVVSRVARRRSVGRTLVAATCRFAAERGIDRVVASTAAAHAVAGGARQACGSFRLRSVALEAQAAQRGAGA
jgi:GNAT superfamily N-acetyltransferase